MISIRWLTQTDIPAITELVKRAGLPERSEAGWRWALFSNPQQGALPPGLVAERNGKLVSMIGLQARDFTVECRRTKAINGHTFISSPEGRGAGFSLARKALKIEGYEAVYSLNNNAGSSRFNESLGLSAWLGQRGRHQVIWPVQPAKSAIGAAMSRFARSEAGHALLARHEWFQHDIPPLEQFVPDGAGLFLLDLRLTQHRQLVDAFGESVSLFKAAAPVRNADIYAHQAADPDAPGHTVLIGRKGTNGLEALAQVTLTKPSAFEPAELMITDLEVSPGTDAAQAIPDMINGIRQMARQARLSRVRLPFAGRFEPVCFAGTGAHVGRDLAYDPAYARFKRGATTLAGHWTPTGFEGDLSFALRTIPVAGQKSGETATKANRLNKAFEYDTPTA